MKIRIKTREKEVETKLKTKTRKEIACEYGIDRRTLGRWIEREKLTIPNGLICPIL